MKLPVRLAVCCMLCTITLCPAAERKRIGLVLEGGGALGLAHIGVLEWLEANQVPVDAISGTSMGGLVGGLYAAGKSPQEIAKLVESIDWDTVLRGQTPFELLGYRRKETRLAYPNRLEFGLRGGLVLPSGLNSGYQVDSIIDRALLPYYGLASFDELPIPFRCVATDMVSGQQKVFDHGSLSQALRATMSIPAVFSPAVDGKQIYTDGGAVNNLPVDIAKAMGVDIIIAVYLDTGPVDPKTLGSFLGLAGRTISIMISANEMRSIQMADILVTADLKGFDPADFKKGPEIIPKGFEAATLKKGVLSLLRMSDNDWSAYTSARTARKRSDVPAPQFIETAGASPAGERAIQAALSRTLHQPLDPASLSRSLELLNGEGSFNSLSYSLLQRDQQTGLLIRATEKNYGPPFLNFGLIIDGSDRNDVRFGFNARLTFLNVAGYGSEWRTDLLFGNVYGLNTELYRPFSQTTKWFAAARLYANRSRFDVYNDRTRIAQYATSQAGGGVDVGYQFGRVAEIRAGQDVEVVGGTLKIGQPIAPNGSRTIRDSSIRFQYLGQDDVVLPRSGVIQQTRFDWSSGTAGGISGSYYSARQQTSLFHTVGDRGSIIFNAAAGSGFGARQLGLQSFTLGGPFHLGAYGVNELLGNQFFLGQAGYSYRLLNLNPLVGESVYALGLFEVGKVYGNPRAPGLPTDGTLALVAKTAFGPIFVGGSANDNRVRWWFGIGRIF